MINFIRYYDDALDKNFCKEIIDRFENNPHQQKDTILENHRSFREINVSQNENWKDVNEKLLDAMQLYLGKYMMDLNIDPRCWPEKVGYESFRIKKYLSNDIDQFDFHVDVNDIENCRRFLAYFFYLNDVDVGGETAFQHNRNVPISLKIKPITGRLLIFPPNWMYPHIGMKPISGPKYILGGYLHYAP